MQILPTLHWQYDTYLVGTAAGALNTEYRYLREAILVNGNFMIIINI